MRELGGRLDAAGTIGCVRGCAAERFSTCDHHGRLSVPTGVVTSDQGHVAAACASYEYQPRSRSPTGSNGRWHQIITDRRQPWG